MVPPAAPASPVPPTPPASRPLAAPRLTALDAARALGTVAMVFGHTIDALLSPAFRDGHAPPFVVAYWKARGITAPLFLLVAGWAVAVALQRAGARGWAAPAGRLPRVLLLLVVGYGLRWPGWGAERLAAGDVQVWSHLLAFDALHTIAVSLLLAACVVGLPWSRRERALLLAFGAVAAVSLGLLPPAPLAPAPAAFPQAPLALAGWQAMGGTSPFPLVPWSAYFFTGAIVGLAAERASPAAAARALLGVGAVLVAATCWTGVGTMPPGDPRLVVFRIGVVFLLLAALSLVPAAWARRVAPLGRASLGVYAIHIALVWGWSTHDGLARRLGQVLTFSQAAAVAALVLAASLAIHHAVVALRRGAVVVGRRLVPGGGAVEL